MSALVNEIEVPAALAGLRRFALDGALLLFDRRTGLTALCDGPETAHLRITAPRVVQFGITNACNLACTFCSRDTEARSAWSEETAFRLLADLAREGTLEVAFGGGEPLAFKGFSRLVERLFHETPLATSLTTNGTLLDDEAIRTLAPCVGQIRLSVYDEVDARPILARLVAHRARFGVNWLVTPERLAAVDGVVLDLFQRGCRDVLLLAYNGVDPALHLTAADARDLSSRVQALGRALEGRMTLKLDVCWGDRLESVPRLFAPGPCGAGREFIVISSDKALAPCSFHHRAFPIVSAADVMRIWREEQHALASPARDPGCARVPDFGMSALTPRLSVLR